MSRRRITPEGAVKIAVMDLLGYAKIPFFRMNAGDRLVTDKKTGETYMIKGHAKGTADILAAPNINGLPTFVWIETKAPGKEPTADQRDFAAAMRLRGHIWMKIDEPMDLQKWLKETGAR